MLEIRNVKKVFNEGTVNEKVALNGLNLVLNDGDFVTAATAQVKARCSMPLQAYGNPMRALSLSTG